MKVTMYWAICTGCSSTAKCPASSKCSSAFGTSLRYASAPGEMNAASRLPHTISVAAGVPSGTPASADRPANSSSSLGTAAPGFACRSRSKKLRSYDQLSGLRLPRASAAMSRKYCLLTIEARLTKSYSFCSSSADWSSCALVKKALRASVRPSRYALAFWIIKPSSSAGERTRQAEPHRRPEVLHVDDAMIDTKRRQQPCGDFREQIESVVHFRRIGMIAEARTRLSGAMTW